MDSRRFVLILAAVILLALTAVAVLARYGSKTGSSNKDKKAINLTDYSAGTAQVRLTVEGPVTANERHRSTMITIGRDSRSMDTFKTYTNDIDKSQSYPNNSPAFEDFMYALKNAGFTRTQGNDYSASANSADDIRGVCPNGKRYIYELYDGGTTIMRLWSTSCSSKQGTFKGNAALVQSLFQKQIPDYNTLSQPSK